MSEPKTDEEHLKNLRLIARSSVVGADVKWLLAEYDRLQIVFGEACNEVKLSHGIPCYCKYCHESATPPVRGEP